MPRTRQAPEPSKTEATERSKTVNLGCRLVNGVVLRVFEPQVNADTGTSGFVESGRVVLGGTKAVTDSSRFWSSDGGAVSVTRGVPRPLWERWLADNPEHPLVVNGLVYEAGDE